MRDTASGFVGTVAGGALNVESGAYSTVVGGFDNIASANDSVAVGRGARAGQQGCFNFASWLGGGTGRCANTTRVARLQAQNGLSVDYFSRRADGGGDRRVPIGPSGVPQTVAT